MIIEPNTGWPARSFFFMVFSRMLVYSWLGAVRPPSAAECYARAMPTVNCDVTGAGPFGSPFSVIPAKAGIQRPLLQRPSGFPLSRERRDKDFENLDFKDLTLARERLERGRVGGTMNPTPM